MTLQAFKKEAGVTELNFKAGKNGHYCGTPIGMVFAGKDYSSKHKIQDVEMGFDDNGQQVYRLTNKPVAFSM